MRILLTTPYDLAVPGGVNRHARDLRRALSQAGHTALLVGPSSARTPDEDVHVRHLGGIWVGHLNGARSRVTLDPTLAPAMGRLIRDFRPDVLHLQEPFLPTLNTAALLRVGPIPVVGTFHTYSETSRGYLWSWPWCRWVSRRLHARIAVSAAARAFATRWHPAPFTEIPNGVHLPPAAARRPDRPPGRPVRLLFVGRADEPRKGFAVLAAALDRLHAAHPGQFSLTCVGPATARGEVSDQELSAAYASADVCIVPSLGGESFGLVALEALAHGVPVVATAIRGYAEWLGGSGAAELVPPHDAAALAAGIVRLALDPARHAACARHGLALAEQYAWSRLATRVLAVYAEAGRS